MVYFNLFNMVYNTLNQLQHPLLQITDNSFGQASMTVKQFQFISWPDHGVPEHGSALLNFHQKIMAHYNSLTSTGPILVHCRYIHVQIHEQLCLFVDTIYDLFILYVYTVLVLGGLEPLLHLMLLWIRSKLSKLLISQESSRK